jgi:hypothetical protein
VWSVFEGKRYVSDLSALLPCTDVFFKLATEVEGIFRLSGSAKRIKDLQEVFDQPPRYGKGLNWEGYTVHDAANVFRRYLNQLPEPIVPLEFYDKFRAPLRDSVKRVLGDTEAQEGQLIEGFDVESAIKIYKQLMLQLPAYNGQLLLYILDLLAVFASKAEFNRMTAANLAAIFQPGLLSHPSHALAPPEYRLSQEVLVFLIDHQDHFLLDRSTAGDAQPPQPTPGKLQKQPSMRVTSDEKKEASLKDKKAQEVAQESNHS